MDIFMLAANVFTNAIHAFENAVDAYFEVRGENPAEAVKNAILTVYYARAAASSYAELAGANPPREVMAEAASGAAKASAAVFWAVDAIGPLVERYASHLLGRLVQARVELKRVEAMLSLSPYRDAQRIRDAVAYAVSVYDNLVKPLLDEVYAAVAAAVGG